MYGPLNITPDALAEEAGKLQRKLGAGIRTLREMDAVDFGFTPREEVWRDGKTVLYRFKGERRPTAQVPILISYALVNRPYMVDLQEDKSLVRGLLERGEEVGGGVFPWSEYATAENAEEAANYAYEDALAEASAWLASRQEPQPKPKRCEKDGPYWLSKCDRPKWVTVCGEGSNWGIQKCESCGGSWEFGDLE